MQKLVKVVRHNMKKIPKNNNKKKFKNTIFLNKSRF